MLETIRTTSQEDTSRAVSARSQLLVLYGRALTKMPTSGSPIGAQLVSFNFPE